MENKNLFNINQDIRNSIAAELSKIETAHDIEILYAIESGSRAWGFPSSDSDYDVRFIYKRTLKEYLAIKQKDDTLTFPINDDLDICGWDIKKVLHHIMKSNAVMYEWLQSPISYYNNNDFSQNLWEIGKAYFSSQATLSHYLGICKKFLLKLEESSSIAIKKLFYILRPLFAAQWICAENSIPPMIFQELMQNKNIPQEICTYIEKLLDIKSEGNEKTMIDIPGNITQYIKNTYSWCENKKEQFTKHPVTSELADSYFYNLIIK